MNENLKRFTGRILGATILVMMVGLLYATRSGIITTNLLTDLPSSKGEPSKTPSSADFVERDFFDNPKEFLFQAGGWGQLTYPKGVAVNATGYIFVTDYTNPRVVVFSPAGQYLFEFGQFIHPNGIAINDTGYVYVSDEGNDRVDIFSPNGLYLYSLGSSGSGNGQFDQPGGIAVNASGYVYVTDYNNQRVQVFSPAGQYVFAWGSLGTAPGQFRNPISVAVNSSGNVYVLEDSGNRVQVFSPSGQYLDMWGGAFYWPQGIVVNASGDVYVTDMVNNRVLVYSSTGLFLYQLGSSGAGNGQFSNPRGITADARGHVYVVDTGNRRVQVFGLHITLEMALGEPSTDAGDRITRTAPRISATIVYHTNYIENLITTASLVGEELPLTLIGTSGTQYVLSPTYSPETWETWNATWASLPDGAYLLDVCATDNAHVEVHQTRQIYKITSNASWNLLYELDLIDDIWEGSGGTFIQNASELLLLASSEANFSLALPALSLTTGDNQLNPLDHIFVRYQTTITSRCSFNLQDTDVKVVSFDLPTIPGEVQTADFILNSMDSVHIDRLNFTGQFAANEYLRVLSIAIIRPWTLVPELTIARPATIEDQVFGSPSAPGVKIGIGEIPQIWASAWGVDSDLANVTATVVVNGTFYQFLLGHPSWPGSLDTDFELSPYGGQWETWCDFWNATGGDGKFLCGEGTYLVNITALDEINVWPRAETNATLLLVRDLTDPGLVITGGLTTGSAYAGRTNVTLQITDNLNYVCNVSCTYDSLEGLANPLDAHWLSLNTPPLAVPGTMTVSVNWASRPEGNTTISFAVLDYGGSVTIRTYHVIVDNTLPRFTKISPDPAAMLTSAVPAYFLQIEERNLASVQYAFGTSPATWHAIGGLPANTSGTTTTLAGSFDAGAWAAVLANASETESLLIFFRATDLAGQVTVANVTVRLDGVAPRAVLAYPVAGEDAAAEAPYFRFSSITDLHFSYMYYTLSGNPTKFYLANGTLEGRIDQPAWNLALNATVVITFHIFDYFGNEAVVTTYVTRMDYTGGASDEPGFPNFLHASWQEWIILGVVAAVTFLVLFAYHRGDKPRAVKAARQALIRRR